MNRPLLPAGLAALLFCSSLGSPAQAQFAGTGADGPFTPTVDTVLDTALDGGRFDFTEFVVPVGVTVTVEGPNAARIFVTGSVLIDGTLEVTPGHGRDDADLVAPGTVFGCAATAAHAIGGGGDGTPYNSRFCQLPIGGARVVCGPDQALGGGYLEISAAGSIQIAGIVQANGGSTPAGTEHGSGGTIVLRSLDGPVVVAPGGRVRALAGDVALNGYVRIETNGATSLLGGIFPPANLGPPVRILGRAWAVSQLAPFQLAELDATLPAAELSAMSGAGFGIATTVRGARWVTFPDAGRIEPFGRSGRRLLLGGNATGALPRGIAADRFDHVWVACGSGTLERYDSFGVLVSSTALGGGPFGVAVDAADHVWVTSEVSNTVHRLDLDGNLQASVPVDPGPRGIAVGADGTLWVTCTGGAGAAEGSLVALDADGTPIGSWPAGPRPLGVAAAIDGRVWVANEGPVGAPGSTVRRFGPDGTLEATFPVGTAPTGISIDGDGSIWVVNSGTLVDPTSTAMRLDPSDGTVLDQRLLPALSTAFGDSTGYVPAMVWDPLGDSDGDGAGNRQELVAVADPFDPTVVGLGDAPEVTAVVPGAALLAGGETLTITGGPFTASWDTTVEIGGVELADVVVVDSGTLTATAPSLPLQGRYDVTVANTNGSGSLVGGFYTSNVVVSTDPADGLLSAPGTLLLEIRTMPFAAPFLAFGQGVGTTPFFGLPVEIPSPVTLLFDPTQTLFTPAADANGELLLGLGVPDDPGLAGLQFSFAAATIDPACAPFGLCFSNGAVVTLE